jgi:sensor domain CHASE-containing protein
MSLSCRFSSLRWSTYIAISVAISGILTVAVYLLALHSARTAASMVETTLAHLTANAEDWGNWDETYDFLTTMDAGYKERNLSVQGVKNIGVDGVIFVDLHRNVVFEQYYLPELATNAMAKAAFRQLLQPNSIVARALRERHGTRSVFAIGGVIYFAASAPILRSERTGEPRGAIIFVRQLPEDFFRILERDTEARISLRTDPASGSSTEPDTSEDFVRTVVELSPQNVLPEKIALQVLHPRAILREGRVTLQYTAGFLMVSIMVIGVLMAALIEQRVVRRALSIGTQLLTIRRAKDHTRRIELTGHDELNELSCSINGLLDEVEQRMSEIEASRDSIHSQAIVFATQVEKLTSHHASAQNRERDVSHLLLSFLGQLDLSISEAAQAVTKLREAELGPKAYQQLLRLNRCWEQVRAIMKEARTALDNHPAAGNSPKQSVVENSATGDP